MQDPLQRSLVTVYANQHPIMQVLPFENITGAAAHFNREGTLPTIAFRGLNAAYTANEGVIDPVTDPLFISGGDLDVDKFLIETGGPSVRGQREKMAMKNHAHTIAHKLVKGSNATDGTEFNGLQVRCLGSQLIAAGSTASGDVLSLAKLDALIAQVPGCNALLMSTQMVTLLTAAARTTSVGGYLTFQPNQFGQRQAFYANIPIYELGTPNHPYATLSFSEAGLSSGSSATSIYAVRFGLDGFHGIQTAPPFFTDFGETQVKPVFRTRMEWYCGSSLKDPFAAARLYSVITGAVVA